MDALFLDDLGNERLSMPRQPGLAFRRLVARDPGMRALAQRARQAALGGAGDVEIGPVAELVHPLRIEGEQVGFLVLSAGRRTERGADPPRAEWIGLAKAGGGISWNEWAEAWRGLPELSADRIRAWRDCLGLYAGEALRGVETGRGVLPDRENLSPLVRDCCRWIEARAGEEVTLAGAAAARGVSPEHLSRRFRAETGLRFREYVAEHRIGRACAALVDTDDPISQIAWDSGFSTLSRFNRSFRAINGMTPREWRKRARMRGGRNAPKA